MIPANAGTDDLPERPESARPRLLSGPLRGGGSPDGAHADAAPVGAGRTARMAELTAALSEAVTSRDVVSVTAERLLPPFGADGLIVHTLDGGRLHIVGSVGYTRDFLDHYLEGLSLDQNAAVSDVLRNRAPRFIESRSEFVRRYPTLRHTVPRSEKQAWAILPLIASGHMMGSFAISFSRPRTFNDDERTLLFALSGLIAQALERARLYDTEHGRAQKLQRALLPQKLPALPAVSVAARYLPAGRGVDVGGDWYDVIPLSADRVALVIGDVMGHGIAEAATMGQLRTAVRTLAELELAPDEVLGQLDGLVRDLGDDYFATCLYAEFDPVNRICRFSSAGHPSPVVVRPDGSVRSSSLPDNPPLGASEPPFDVHEVRLPTDSLLVFYTDGLIESATRDMDEGLAQLIRILSTDTATARCLCSGRGPEEAVPLDRLCDVITSSLLPDQEDTSDDAALLIARTRHTADADVVSWSLPQDATAAGQAREYVQRQLSVWHLDDLVPTTELLVSELVGNAIRYAQGPIGFRMIRSDALICEVSDGSLTTPRIRRAAVTDEGGRGLQLVAALSQRWGTRYTGDGKCIWTEQRPTPHAG